MYIYSKNVRLGQGANGSLRTGTFVGSSNKTIYFHSIYDKTGQNHRDSYYVN